jgi:glutamate racemase
MEKLLCLLLLTAPLYAAPVGVFDSGIGGLTVLEALLEVDAFHNDSLKSGADGRPDLAAESFQYLGDQANMPYGNYAAAGKADFLRELIQRDAAFLRGTCFWPTVDASKPAEKVSAKAIVIACNTATAFGLEDVRKMLPDTPVVGVVEAGTRGLLEAMAKESGAVGVLATVGTCSCEAYPKAIRSVFGLAGRALPTVMQQGSVGLAGAIEGDLGFVTDAKARTDYQGPSLKELSEEMIQACAFDPAGLLGEGEATQLNSVENYIAYDVVQLVDRHRSSGSKEPLRYVILGCTHFPLVMAQIAEKLQQLRRLPRYAECIAEQPVFINPAELTVKELFRELARHRLRSQGDAQPSHEFYISVPNPKAPGVKLDPTGIRLDRAYQYSRDSGTPDRDDTRVVPMTPAVLPKTSLHLLQTKLPNVWHRMTHVPPQLSTRKTGGSNLTDSP